MPTVGMRTFGIRIVPPFATTVAATASTSATATVHSKPTVGVPGMSSRRFWRAPRGPGVAAAGGDDLEEARRPPGLEAPAEDLLIEAPRAAHVVGVDREVGHVAGDGAGK